jgi:hypothetical protein
MPLMAPSATAELTDCSPGPTYAQMRGDGDKGRGAAGPRSPTPAHLA